MFKVYFQLIVLSSVDEDLRRPLRSRIRQCSLVIIIVLLATNLVKEKMFSYLYSVYHMFLNTRVIVTISYQLLHFIIDRCNDLFCVFYEHI